jgi:hypothetical protein
MSEPHLHVVVLPQRRQAQQALRRARRAAQQALQRTAAQLLERLVQVLLGLARDARGLREAHGLKGAH